MDYFEQIDDYLNSRLSADQEALFEQELNNNEALAKAVDNHDLVSAALDMMLEDDIRAQMKPEMSSNADERHADEVTSFPWKWIALILTTIFVLLFILNRYQNQQVDHEHLYAINFKPYIAPGDRGTTDVLQDAPKCDQGHYLMTRAEITQAIELLEQSIQENESCADKARWLLALAHLKTDHLAQSKAQLKSLDSQSAYAQRAQQLLAKLQ